MKSHFQLWFSVFNYCIFWWPSLIIFTWNSNWETVFTIEIYYSKWIIIYFLKKQEWSKNFHRNDYIFPLLWIVDYSYSSTAKLLILVVQTIFYYSVGKHNNYGENYFCISETISTACHSPTRWIHLYICCIPLHGGILCSDSKT